jgi:NAD(P)H-flavin reductase/hemoglobin-like flavoprotein
VVDTRRLQENFELVARTGGDEVGLWFYSHLFVSYPETRAMFPLSMGKQRDRLVNALGQIVANVDKVDELVPFLQQLGREHRKFDAIAAHYPAVGASLVATLAHFSGDQWSEQLSADWQAAYRLVAQTMIEAADESAQYQPPWWDAQILENDRRYFDVAVIRVRPEHWLDYRPGQSISVETALRPKQWRYFSPANAPRQDGTIDLHVQVVDGGPVSTALVNSAAPGDRLRLGAPIGTALTLTSPAGPDLLLIAGGTGLAPMKALIEQIAYEGGQRRVHLFHGAQTGYGLYDLPELQKFAAEHNWLTITPVVSDDPLYEGHRGLVGEFAARSGDWSRHEVYLCGSKPMVRSTASRLREAGVPETQIHFDTFDPR